MKTVYKWLVLLIFISCSSEENLLEELPNGGYIQFVEVPGSEFPFSNLESFKYSGKIIDPNHNAQSYSLTLYHEDKKIDDFLTITSFPSSFDIDIHMIVDALGITISDISIEDEFRFVATVVTPTGIFYGTSPDFDGTTGELNGNTSPRLFRPSQKDAMDFEISFF